MKAKRIQDFFKSNKELMDLPEVSALIEYCQDLEGELHELEISKQYNKEQIMLDFIDDVYKSCKQLIEQDIESQRFKELPKVDYSSSVKNLQLYIEDFCKTNKISL